MAMPYLSHRTPQLRKAGLELLECQIQTQCLTYVTTDILGQIIFYPGRMSGVLQHVL